MNTQERISEYFATHPDATECYEALGKVFAEKEKAQKYLAGVAGRCVTTHSREGMNFERESDRMKHQIFEQENHVNDKHLAYENAASIDKQAAMGEWVAAKDVLHKMNSRLEKQLVLEEKDELLAKEEKASDKTPVQKELTVDQLKAKVSAQQQIVDSNVKLMKKIKDAKKLKAAEKVQKAEIKVLEKWKADLSIAEQKEADTAAIQPAVETPVTDVPETVDHEATQENQDNNTGLPEEGKEDNNGSDAITE